MNRIDRLLGYINILQSKKYVSSEYLSNHFNISIRTVYRDISSLGTLNIPVSFEPNKGYFIVHGFFLPPVMFTPEEANAIILMETISEKYADKSIKRNVESAVSKIKNLLNEEQKLKSDYFHSQIRIKNDDRIASEYLVVIQNSISNRISMTIEYKNIKGIESVREIEPIGLTYYGEGWHVIAWCWMRYDYRDFRLSRITSIDSTQKPFRKNNLLDINDYIRSLRKFK